MNDTQWLFEYEGLRYAEERKLEEYKAMATFIKKGFISLLGLDLFPIEEEAGLDQYGEPIMRYRYPEDHEIMPLAIFVGREEIIAEAAKRHQEFALQESADAGETREEYVSSDLTPEELDRLIDGDDASDISFPTNPEDIKKHLIWNSSTTKSYLSSMVKDINEKDEDLETGSGPLEIKGDKKTAKVCVE